METEDTLSRAEAGGPAPSGGGVVCIAGRGRVGRSLFLAVQSAGHEAELLRGRPSRPAARTADADTVRAPIGTLFLCVPDDALPSCAARLARSLRGRLSAGSVALHTSGACDASVLAPLAELGCRTGSWHPLQTFALPGADVFPGIRIAVEGAPEAVAAGERLARDLGAVPFAVPGELKALYHALCTMACGHLSALLLLCHDGLAAFPDAIRQDLWPSLLGLARSAIDNMARLRDPRQAVTGPAARGDRKTVARHCAAIRRLPALAGEVYALLDQATVRSLQGAPRPDAGEIPSEVNTARSARNSGK